MASQAVPSDSIAVRPVVPASDLAYRRFLIASLLLAVLIGFVLGIHVAVNRLLDIGRPERTADLIQAHGQVQLLGFAGLYVIGMSLRLLPRFAGGRLQLGVLLPVVLWPMVVSLLVRSAVMPWFSGDTHQALLLASTFGVLVASSAYLLLVTATLTYGARRPDASSVAFLLGALVLYAASAIGTFAAIDVAVSGQASIPYLANVAITLLQLLGFLVVFIVGVGLRALPVLVGREQPARGAARLPGAIVACVGIEAAALLYLQYGAYSEAVVLVAAAAQVALGLTLLTFVGLAGVLRPRANRARPASQPALWLVRSAFAWLLATALLMVYFGVDGFLAGALIAQSEFDAIRHAAGLGLVTNLILGMSLMILPEFAGERQHANRQRLLALVLAALINVAAVLRVAPAVAADAWPADTRNASMAAAGSLAELALVLFAAYLLRLMWRGRGAGA